MSKNWRMLAGLLFLGSVEPCSHPLTCLISCISTDCRATALASPIWPGPGRNSRPRPSSPHRRNLRVVRRTAQLTVRQRCIEKAQSPRERRIAKQAVPMPPAKIAEPPPAGNTAAVSGAAGANVAVSSSPAARLPFRCQNSAGAGRGRDGARGACDDRECGPVPQPEANNAEIPVVPKPPSPAIPSRRHPCRRATRTIWLPFMARPEIKSVSDLTGKDVAIGDQQSASSASIRTAIAAAGAVKSGLTRGMRNRSIG